MTSRLPRWRPSPPPCRAGIQWLRVKYGKGNLAALTGQDGYALEAAIHVLDLYARSDAHGKRSAITALGALVAAMQPGCRTFVRDAIPYVLDYGDVDKLWPQISGESSS